MDLQNKIVDEIPLKEIWNQNKVVSRERLKYLKSEDVRTLLKQGKVQFVVANIGCALNWILIDKCFDFFRNELKNRIADDEENCLESFPDNYFYFASIWKSDSKIPVVLLEMNH